MPPRLPAQLEVSALLRSVQAQGGFGAVLHKGEREGGTIMVVMAENGANLRVYERMPGLDGARVWHLSKVQDVENKQEFQDYLNRRCTQDPDLWILELDIANGERLIGLMVPEN